MGRKCWIKSCTELSGSGRVPALTCRQFVINLKWSPTYSKAESYVWTINTSGLCLHSSSMYASTTFSSLQTELEMMPRSDASLLSSNLFCNRHAEWERGRMTFTSFKCGMCNFLPLSLCASFLFPQQVRDQSYCKDGVVSSQCSPENKSVLPFASAFLKNASLRSCS